MSLTLTEAERSILPKIQSGSFEGTPDELAILVKNIVSLSTRMGLTLAKEELRAEVAKKTGLMRGAFDKAMDNIIKQITPATKIRININDVLNSMIADVDYTVHHVDGAPKTELPFYKDPTTPGTFPLLRRKMSLTIRRNIDLILKQQLKNAGLKVR